MASKKDNPTLDPIAYREDYPEENIIGTEQANESFSAYGDDSDLAHQQQSLGGMNDKYGGEGVGIINYNEDATLSNLPSYIYGKEANQTGEEGYLTKRNDNVASALFNEGKLTKEDVVNYLAQQQGWNNSSEMDRLNTVEAIWKRIGNLQGNGEKKEDNIDTSKMTEDLNKDTSGTIYGKTTADEGNPKKGIDTLTDANSVFQMMNNARIVAVEEMLSMGVDSLAAMQYSGTNPYNETNWRDFRKYYPDMAAQIDQKVKEMNSQDVVNAITSGKTITTTADKTDVSGQATSYAVNNASGSTTATQLLQGINSILESNDTAKSAEELMGSIEKDMATLKNRMKNLKSEVTAQFKGDALDYLVKAAMNNKSQELQNQLSILEDRYNAAYNRYKTELSHAEWEAEYKLKQESLALDEWKAKNTTTTTTTNTNYTVAERNNNPTNMTVGFMQWAGAELGVDYEVSTDSFWSDGKQLYYAKLLGDPIETTIRILDKAIAQGKNPFNTTSWSYINQLGMNIEKWNSMTDDQRKSFIVNDWLPHEGGDITKMAYYAGNNSSKSTNSYDLANSKLYDMYLDPAKRPNEKFVENAAKVAGQSVEDFANSARAYQADLNAGLISNTTPGEIKSSYAYEMLEMFANLYNHVDDNWNNKVDFSRWNPFLYEFDLWNQIRENMTLESMVSAKERDVNFGSVTEAEWTMLRNAASAIGSAYWGFDTTMDDEFQRMIRVLWKKAYGDESFNLDKWTDFRKEYEKKAAWANPEKLIKSTASEGLGAWQNDSGAFTEPTDGNYVNAYGIIG